MIFCFRVIQGKVEITSLNSEQSELFKALKKAESNAFELYFDSSNSLENLSWVYWRHSLDLLGEHFNSVMAAIMWSSFSSDSDLSLPESSDITLYGGSFNPFHKGHQACLDLCPTKNIVLVPTWNPQKESRPKNFETLFLELSKKWLTYPGEMAGEKSPYVIDWLPKWHRRYALRFLMGDDTFVSLFTWKRFEEVLRILKIIYVVERNQTENLINEKIKSYQAINSAIQIERLSGNFYRDLSSSKLR